MSKTVKISILLLLLIGFYIPFFAEDNEKEANEKTKITAENFTYRIAKGEAVYSGDVVVLDMQIEIFTDKMTVIFAKAKRESMERFYSCYYARRIGCFTKSCTLCARGSVLKRCTLLRR